MRKMRDPEWGQVGWFVMRYAAVKLRSIARLYLTTIRRQEPEREACGRSDGE
jgi:hypothetical protein